MQTKKSDLFIIHLLHKRRAQQEQHTIDIEQKKAHYDDPNLDLDTRRKNFYNSESKHTPEYRRESQRFREILEEEDERKKNEEIVYGFEEELDPESRSKPRKLFEEKSGKALNVNEARLDFHYNDYDPEYLISPSTGQAKQERAIMEEYFPTDYNYFQVGSHFSPQTD